MEETGQPRLISDKKFTYEGKTCPATSSRTSASGTS